MFKSLFHQLPTPRVKLEKERREKSRQLGPIRTEGWEGGGEDMERERRLFQLQMCEVSYPGFQRDREKHTKREREMNTKMVGIY